MHTIYEIPSRKVGCTKNLDRRKELYFASGLDSSTEFKVLEILENVSDIEAGVIEREWQQKLGYQVDTIRYEVSVANMKARAKIGGTKGGKIAALTGKAGILHRTAEKKTADGKLGNKAQPTAAKKLGGTNMAATVRMCPHCSHEGRGPNVFRYHFENCQQKNAA